MSQTLTVLLHLYGNNIDHVLKLSKQVENTVGKGEIACYEQFLLFQQCFQKACFPGALKGVIVWEWVKYASRIVSPWTYKILLNFFLSECWWGYQVRFIEKL